MNKYFALMILAGVAIWGNFAWRLAVKGNLIPHSLQNSQEDTRDNSGDSAQSSMVFKAAERNPFALPSRLAIIHAPSVPQKAPAKIDTAPPPFKVDAILPGANPVVILRNGSKTIFAKPGEVVWDAKIISIAGDAVTLQYKDVTQTLRRK